MPGCDNNGRVSTVLSMFLNINGLRSKTAELSAFLGRFQEAFRKVTVVALAETRMRADDRPPIPGFRLVARRDRTSASSGPGTVIGGGVAIYVADEVEALVLDHEAGDDSETATIIIGTDENGPRYLVGYRAPDDDDAAFLRALEHQAEEAAELGVGFVAAFDSNLPELRLAQGGSDRRLVGDAAAETARCRRFKDVLERTRLVVKSGTVASCGTELADAATFMRVRGEWTALSQLDLVVANEAARVSQCGTENCGPLSVLHGSDGWERSDHSPVWAAADCGPSDGGVLDLGDVVRLEALPRADWDMAGEEERAELRRLIKERQAPLLRRLRDSGLDTWGGSWTMAVAAFVRIWVGCETDAVGRPSRKRRRGGGTAPPVREAAWVDDGFRRASVRVRAAHGRLRAAAGRLSAAEDGTARRRERRAVSAAASELREARAERDAQAVRAWAAHVSGRVKAAAGDYRGLRAAHALVKGMVRPGSLQDGAAVVLGRELRDARSDPPGARVRGRDAVGVLMRDYAGRQTADPGDVRYHQGADAARRAEFARLRRRVFGSERRAAEAAVVRFGGRDWRRWARAVVRGDVQPTREERSAYGAAPYSTAEVYRVMRHLRTGRAADPEDGLGSNLVRNGGWAMARAWKELLYARLLDPWARTPGQVLHATPVYKGGGRDPLEWLSYRMIMLLSYVTKVEQSVLLHRALVCGSVDESQSVGNRGVDARHQLHLALDVVAWRRARGEEQLLAVVDLLRGFPNALREDVYLAMRAAGVGPHIVEGLASLDFGSAVAIKVAPGRYTPNMPVSRGILEGGADSPAKFSFQTAGLPRALRGAGCGVAPFGAFSAAALVHMDDVGIFPRDVRDLRCALDVVFEWLYVHGHEASAPKLGFAKLGRVVGGDEDFDYVWLPSEEDEPDVVRRAAALVHTTRAASGGGDSERATFATASAVYLGYEFGGGVYGHVRRQISIVHRLVDAIEGGERARRCLSVERALWVWTIYARHAAEKWSAVWPSLTDAEEGALERAQTRALRALLGGAVEPEVRLDERLVRAVFGVWRLSDRRWLEQMRYVYSLPAATVRPWRRQVVGEFHGHARGSGREARDFARHSPTGNLQRQTRRLAVASQGVGISVPGPRPPAGGAGRGSSSSSDGSEEDTDDDDPTRLRGHARVRAAAAKRVIAAVVALDVESGLGQSLVGGLFVELAPTKRWLTELHRGLRADAEGLAVLALMAGAFWPCPECRAGPSFPPRRCVCGYCSGDGRSLTLHFCFGYDGVGRPCLEAQRTRKRWVRRVRRTFAEHGADARAAGAPSLGKLARWLGGGGGERDMRPELARRLPHIFTETFGRWAARRRGFA